jgi:hypothetical protein
VLILEGKCSCWRAKLAHLAGHLPHAKRCVPAPTLLDVTVARWIWASVPAIQEQLIERAGRDAHQKMGHLAVGMNVHASSLLLLSFATNSACIRYLGRGEV